MGKVARVTLAVKNVSVEEEEGEEEEQVSVTLLCDVDNDGDVQIPDTAHQISTGELFLTNFYLFIY